MNDKIIKREVRQACNAWILELLYHEFATQESLLSCAEFRNDKINKHEVRQAYNAWILELLYPGFYFKLTNALLQSSTFCYAEIFVR